MNIGAYELDSVHCTDALTLPRGLPDGSVNCCVTSPPYFGLRDYGVDGQIGLEDTPDAYVAALVEVFREVRRVLRDDGTLWLNLGDSYASSGKACELGKPNLERHGGNGINPKSETYKYGRAPTPLGMKPKDLIGIPWMVAFALRADGWYLRSDIIWHKPNCMPESVTDRPTKAHEYLFLLSKCASYYYDVEAIKEPAQDWGTRDRSNGKYTSGDVPISGGRHHGLKGIPKQDALGKRTYTGFNERYFSEPHEPTRNKRTVWTIPTQPYDGAHFAVMPEKLVEPCILAGCPETVCAACGAPHERVVERTPMQIRRTDWGEQAGNRTASSGTMISPPVHTTLGFAPTCTCDAGTAHGIVLDPFGGAATVGVVAKRLNRRYLLSEINPVYVELARDRLAGVTPMLAGFAEVSHAP